MQSLYTAAVLDHFKNPRNAGDVSGATATVEVQNPVCGDILRLSMRVENGHIAEAGFKTQGCVAAIACSSLLTELVRGATPDEAGRITPAQISGALGGLPPATLHGAQLACDALAALLKQIK
jgi:nitrogen fixation NifU-like protein